MANRNIVMPILRTYLPADDQLLARKTIGLEHIIKDYGDIGTTCGFLPHWLWWRMGCSDAKLMCRYEPDTPFTYHAGAQINRVYAHNRFVSLGRGMKNSNDDAFIAGSIYPKAGDAVIIQGPPDAKGNDTSHIFVTLDAGEWVSDTKGTWLVAEAGQIGNGAHVRRHTVEFRSGKWWMGSKWMLGWLDIDQVGFGAPLPNPDYLSRYAREAVPANAATFTGIWTVTDGTESWYYFFHKGFRVFYSDAGSPTMLRGGGYWVPRAGGVVIHWDWGNEERLTPTSSSPNVATGSYGAGSLDAKKVVKATPKLNKFSANIGPSFL